MGVTVDVWRMRIGSFHASHTQKNQPNFCKKFSSGLYLPLLLILALLLIGNIEANPGPRQFKCPHCELSFASLSLNVLHQKIHSCNSGFKFCCPKLPCLHKFDHLTSIQYHLKSVHLERKETVQPATSSSSSQPVFKCSIGNCSVSTTSSQQHCKHNYDHIENGEVVFCPLKYRCKQDLQYGGPTETIEKALSRLRSHLSLYHPGWRDGHTIPPPPEPQVSYSSCDWAEFGDSEDQSSPQAGVSFCSLPDESLEDHALTDLFAKFYLMLEGELCLPETSVQHICERLSFVSEMVLEQTKTNLMKALHLLEVEEDKIAPIVNHVLVGDVFYAVHHKDASGPNLTSDHFRKSYYRDNFNLKAPEQEPLDLDMYGESVVYVPIRDTLSSLLKDPSVKKQIYKSFERDDVAEDGVYRDYYSGRVYKNRSHYGKKKIDLLIFQDGFSVTNPLGSAKNSHKLIGTYFTIGNMDSYLRSKVKLINIITLFYEKQFKDPTIGFDCFRPMFDELTELSTKGIDFDGVNIPVFLQFMIGDSLGAHTIGGFVECFTHQYFCRYCEITRAELQQDASLVKPLRSPNSYKNNLDKLNELKEQSANPEKIIAYRGIKRFSEFNNLPDFHVCDPALPPCLGHDLFEGVVAWDLNAIILKFVDLNWFTIDKVNQRIKNFGYTLADSGNKPAPIQKSNAEKKKKKKKKKNESTKKKNPGLLKGHAVQNWCFLRLLPLILQGLIKDTSNPYWQLYLKLRNVVEFACKPSFKEEDIQKFDSVVQDYLKSREDLLDFVKPKLHFVAHYPELIRWLGSIIHLWTLRFESKHAFFKEASRMSNNFINLCLTLVKKHQLYVCYLNTGSIIPEGYSKSRECKAKEYSAAISSVLSDAGIQDDSLFYDALNCDEIHYSRNFHVLLENGTEHDTIKIGRIEVITVSAEGDALFVLKVFTATLWEEFGLFKIDRSKSALSLVKQKDLQHPIPHAVYELNDEECVSLKYRL